MLTQPPTLFCLHFLGGSAREWTGMAQRLEPSVRCVPIDLPGFGDASGEVGMSVDGMADIIAERISVLAPERWLIAGHSMGAKVALALARRAEDGSSALEGFDGLVLLAGSPPSPEPMSDDKRREMTAWITADETIRFTKAGDFIDQNVEAPLSDADRASAVADVLRANPEAWIAWLQSGSREDWCRKIGVLRSRALVISGAEDADLGPDAQTCLTMPHLANARHVVVEGAGHLLPLERPDTIADLIREMVMKPILPTRRVDPLPGSYGALIASPRVNTRLRAALDKRTQPADRLTCPGILDAIEYAILRSVVDRVLPQPAGADIDIGARIETRLASGSGDGWRFADLPPDPQAYAAALRTLDTVALSTHRTGFLALPAAEQDALLVMVAAGELPTAGAALDGKQMKLWFEDLRGDVVRTYLAHPAALARLGFSGIGAGGDDPDRLTGFVEVGLDAPAPWEPVATAGDVR